MIDINFLALVDSCLSTNIRKLSRIMTRLYDLHLEPACINITQLAILLTIQGMNQDIVTSEIFVTSSKVANRLGMDKSTLSRNMRNLEDIGYIELIPSTLNRKEKMIKIKDKGQQIILTGYPYWLEVQNQIKENFGENNFDEMLKMLHNLDQVIEMLD